MASLAPAEKPLFTETNIGTRLVIAVSPSMVVGDLKGMLEKEHFLCFPYLGEITVLSLKVKRKSHLYHLPNSMTVLLAFQGFKGNWFIHMDVSGAKTKKKSRKDIGQILSMERASATIREFVQDKGDGTYKPQGHDLCRHLNGNNRDESVLHDDLVEAPLTPAHNQWKNKKRAKEIKKTKDMDDGGREDNLIPVSCRETHSLETIGNINAVEDPSEVYSKQAEPSGMAPAPKHSFSAHSLVIGSEKPQHGEVDRVMAPDQGLPPRVSRVCNGEDPTNGICTAKSKKRQKTCRNLGSTENATVGENQRHSPEEYKSNADGLCGATERPCTLLGESSLVSSSSVISVTGIIARYFSNPDEVNSPSKSPEEVPPKKLQKPRLVASRKNSKNCRRKKMQDSSEAFSPLSCNQRNQCPCLMASDMNQMGTNVGKHEIGKRLLFIANELGVSAPSLKRGTLDKDSSRVRNVVFEIEDEET